MFKRPLKILVSTKIRFLGKNLRAALVMISSFIIKELNSSANLKLLIKLLR